MCWNTRDGVLLEQREEANTQRMLAGRFGLTYFDLADR